MNQSLTCKNCGAPMNGDFCAHCGQKTALPLDSKRIFHDIWEHFVDLDFALARSFRDIFLRPQVMIQNYIEGRRKSYTNPFKLLFLCSTFYFLAMSYFDVKVDVFSQGDINEAQARQVVALMSYLVYLFLLPAAWFFQLIYGKKLQTYAESYVSLAYIWSLYLLLISLLTPVSLFSEKGYGLLRFAIGILAVWLVTKRLYGTGWLKGLLLSVLFYMSYFLSTAIVMAGVITIAYLVGYEPLMFRPG